MTKAPQFRCACLLSLLIMAVPRPAYPGTGHIPTTTIEGYVYYPDKKSPQSQVKVDCLTSTGKYCGSGAVTNESGYYRLVGIDTRIGIFKLEARVWRINEGKFYRGETDLFTVRHGAVTLSIDDYLKINPSARVMSPQRDVAIVLVAMQGPDTEMLRWAMASARLASSSPDQPPREAPRKLWKLSGIAHDENNHPIPDVTVLITEIPASVAPRDLAQGTGQSFPPITTDTRGRYEQSLHVGDYVLYFVADGYEPQLLRFQVLSKDNIAVYPFGSSQLSGAPQKDLSVTLTSLRPTAPVSGGPGNAQVRSPTADTRRLEQDLDLQGQGAKVDTLSMSRGSGFASAFSVLLPLAGWRSPDNLAFLAPGVTPPPQPVGPVIPGVAPGIGSPGQFSINGLRGRDNNFTVDGSDNNDEEIGTRRQGLMAPFPQTIETLAEFQVVTSLADATYGRGVSGQIDAMTRLGESNLHGQLWGFGTGGPLNAANAFEVKNNAYPAQYRQQVPITNDGLLGDGSPGVIFDTAGSTVPLPFQVNGLGQGFQSNPTARSDRLFRLQGGFLLGGPIRSTKTHFIVSYERHTLRQTQQTNFAVTTANQRQICPSLDQACSTGSSAALFNYPFPVPLFPSSLRGDAIWSLYPFPNNPLGPYGANTFTEQLPADGNANIFLLELDRQFDTRLTRNTLSVRYNGSNESSILPSTGDAVFSSIKPVIFTQNAALFLNTVFSSSTTNTLRISYGGTNSHFSELRDAYLAPSTRGSPLLLNAPLLLNITTAGAPLVYQAAASTGGQNLLQPTGGFNGEYFGVAPGATPVWADQIDTAGLARLSVGGFSSVGADTSQIPQQRADSTWQWADTMTVVHGRHLFNFGVDVRRVQLNSLASPPEASANYGGLLVSGPSAGNLIMSPASLVSTGIDAASETFPLVVCPSTSSSTPSATAAPCAISSNYYSLNLRSTEADFFVQDEIRVFRNFRIIAGVRSQYAPVPHDVSGHFNEAFNNNTESQLISGCSFPVCSDYANVLRALLPQSLQSAFDPRPFGVDGRAGFAWDLFGDGIWAIRGGWGSYSGQFPAILVDESRNVFPSFLTLSGGVNTSFGSSLASTYNMVLANGVIFLRPGQYPGPNQLYALAALSTELSSNSISADLTYPAQGLKNPYAEQANFTVEGRLSTSVVVSLAYVGTRGNRLLSETTPNGGSGRNAEQQEVPPTVCPTGCPLVAPIQDANNVLTNFPFPITGTSFNPNAAVGSSYVTPVIFGGAANSTYNSLQATIHRRFTSGFQFASAFTWSHAIDNASDFSTLAGAFALPQDSTNPSERASSNFDTRFRSVTQFLLDSSGFLERFGVRSHGSWDKALSSWQLSGIVTFQSGQPYTINTVVDVNEDGNMTDRLNSTTCLVPGTSPRVQWQVASTCVNPLLETGVTPQATGFLANPGQPGSVGRNTFTGFGLYNVDLALSRHFTFSEKRNLIARVEAYNALNQPDFGIPDRILESPSFGKAVNTVAPQRIIQLALKYTF